VFQVVAEIDGSTNGPISINDERAMLELGYTWSLSADYYSADY